MENTIMITIPQPERFRAPTFDDYLRGLNSFDQLKTYDATGCVTRMVNIEAVRGKFDLSAFKLVLNNFLTATEKLRADDIHTHYHSFKIPKKSGGLRQINAPDDELKFALQMLVNILSNVMPRTYHTNAYAYVTGRCTYDAVAKHQRWESNWFGHFDFRKFFDSTTKEFLMSQMAKQYPFALIKEDAETWTKLSQALDLCFLDGGLPQGTPASPLLTNIMMIPFDYEVTQDIKAMPNRKSPNGTDRFIYTRYADDIHISCRVEFDIKEQERYLIQKLREQNAPFTINAEKTHYGNRSGQNWMLGYVLNASNAISIGHQNKKHIKAMIHTYAMDKRNQIMWDKDDLMTMLGKIQYWRFSEKELVDYTLERLSQKYGFNVLEEIKADMSNAA